MGMTLNRHRRKAFQSTGLHRYCERAEIKIKHFHEGNKATGKAARAFRVLLRMEKALCSKFRGNVLSSSVRTTDCNIRTVANTVAGKALPRETAMHVCGKRGRSLRDLETRMCSV